MAARSPKQWNAGWPRLTGLALRLLAMGAGQISVLLVGGTARIDGASAQEAPATHAKAPLACAVVGTGSSDRSLAICDALGAQLGRATLLVDEGSSVERGDSLHIVKGDVNWTVIFLHDGEPRTFTRVSAADAAGREVLFLARATRVLIREAGKVEKGCLRVEPNGGRPMRSPELAYPWVNLKKCRAQVVDVIDPWWSSPT